VTAAVLAIAYVYLTDPQNTAAIQQSLSVNRRGVMGASCPDPNANACGNRLCDGDAGMCSSSSFLRGCKCSNECQESPDDIRWYLCDEEECGERDESGDCTGVSAWNRVCQWLEPGC
jgi:hypothetical protein